MESNKLIHTTKQYKVHPNLSRFGAEMIMVDGYPVFIFDKPFNDSIPEGWKRIAPHALQWNNSHIGLSALKQIFPDFSKDDIYINHDVKIVEMSSLLKFLNNFDDITGKNDKKDGSLPSEDNHPSDSFTDINEQSRNSSRLQKKIEDAGVKIGGAKKDRFANLANIKRLEDEISSMNEIEILNDFNKNAIVTFDVINAVKNGMPLKNALTIKHLIAEFPSFNARVQFNHNYRKLDRFKMAATYYASKLIDFKDFLMKASSYENHKNILLAALQHLKELAKEIDSLTPARRDALNIEQRAYRNNHYSIGYIFDEYQAKEIIKRAEYKTHNDKFFNMSDEDFLKHIETSKKKQKENTSEKENEKLTPWTRPHLEKIERKGLPMLREEGVDVTPEMFIETFGFRAVEFGNWLPNDERQDVLNRAYDSFYTLSLMTGIEPRNIGLPGIFGDDITNDESSGMAIAFGARGNGGRGNFAAHWEIGRCVMNLTRFNGAGSIAHEYGHAIDNYVAKILKHYKEFSGSKSKYGYFSSGRWIPKIGTIYSFREIENCPPEVNIMLRRMHNILHDLIFMVVPNMEDLYLKNPALRQVQDKSESYRKEKIRYLEGRMHIAADIMARAIKDVDAREKFRKEIPISIIGMTSSEQMKLRDLMNQVSKGNEILDAYYILKDNNLLDRDKYNISSVYFDMARRLDKDRSTPYFSLAHEMFARMFESFVEDKITAYGGIDHYLVYGTNENLHDIRYPMGIEREVLGMRLGKFTNELNSFINNELRNIHENKEANVPVC